MKVFWAERWTFMCRELITPGSPDLKRTPNICALELNALIFKNIITILGFVYFFPDFRNFFPVFEDTSFLSVFSTKLKGNKLSWIVYKYSKDSVIKL